MSAIRFQLPTFGGVAAVRQKADAAKLIAQLTTRYGADDLERRLQLVQEFRTDGNGRLIPPPQLTLGIDLDEEVDNSGRVHGIVRPSKESERSGHGHAVQVFHNPDRDYGLLLLGTPTERPKTLEASLMLRSVPASAEGLVDMINRLKGQVPPMARTEFNQTFLTPLRNLVLPPDRDNPFVRRELVLWVPYALALKEWFDQLTALLDKDPLSPGEIAALIAASLAARPMPEAFSGTLNEMLWRAAPFDPQPQKGVFLANGERWVFFYFEPRLEEDAFEALLELDMDYQITFKMVHGHAKAQFFARGLDNIPGAPWLRAAHFRKQLTPLCDVLKPITNSGDVALAHWAFQPGSPLSMQFGALPIPDLRTVITALTRTLSTPRDDGNVFVGIETLGSRYLLPLGQPKKGGIFHFLLLGEGGVGKTTLSNLIASQIAATAQVAYVFTERSDEALPTLAYQWAPYDHEPRLLSDYVDGSERVREGIHKLCVPARGDGKKAVREWVFNFRTEWGSSLQEAFANKVVPAVRAWLHGTEEKPGLQFPRDFPISVRLHEGCNPALFAAAVALSWSGRTPWEEDLFPGLQIMVTDYLSGLGVDARCALRFEDPGKMPLVSNDPKDFSSRCTLAVQKVVLDAMTVLHGSGIHVLLSCQSLEELEAFLPGTRGRFHRVIFVRRTEVKGVTKRVYTLCDPHEIERVQATLIGDLNDYPALLNLLTRE